MSHKRVYTGLSIRHRTVQKLYERFKVESAGRCVFCTVGDADNPILREFTHFWLIAAKFPYYAWDGLKLTEHLLFVPKRHTDSLAELSPDELLEYATIVAEYEGNGYSVYARASTNKQKSVVHQHTHFMKLGTSIRGQIYLSKPYLNLAR